MARLIRKLVIAGVGLIGGSFALALRRAGAVESIVGIGRTAASLQAAMKLGVIDRTARDWGEALADADLLFLAMPVGQMEPVMRSVAPHLDSRTIVTDGGSTKRDVVAAARASFGDRLGQVVPSHPIAGAEKSGVGAASATLFRGRRVIMTPLAENAPVAVERVSEIWEACGAVVSTLTPEAHDAVFAAVSHLPHILAFALVEELAARSNAAQLFSHAAGGFRDFTRIAASHPEMWRDICVANRDELTREIDAYLDRLRGMRHSIETGDGAALEAAFERARNARNKWVHSGKPPGQ